MDSETCQIVSIIILTFFGGIVMTTIGGVVVSDYVETKHYSPYVCDGNVDHLHTDTNGIAYYGTLSTWILDQNNNRTSPVVLYFPPINHWELLLTKHGEVQTWASGLVGVQSFTCWVDESMKSTSEVLRGITGLFDGIAGYGSLLAIGCLILLIYVLAIMYVCWTECKRLIT